MEVIESSNFKCLFGNDSMPTLPKIGGILRELVLGGSKGVTVRWTLWVRVSDGLWDRDDEQPREVVQLALLNRGTSREGRK